jgi:hypothetical protein
LLWRPKDDGASWEHRDPPGGGNSYRPYVIDSTGRLLFGTDTLYESPDQGNTWCPIGTPDTKRRLQHKRGEH